MVCAVIKENAGMWWPLVSIRWPQSAAWLGTLVIGSLDSEQVPWHCS